MQFAFLPLPEIYFGPQTFHSLGSLIRQYGSHVFVVASKSALKENNEIKKVLDQLEKDLNHEFEYYHPRGEPTVESIDIGVEKARKYGAEVVLGIGGGSIIDSSKAIAALITNNGSVRDYMEVIGKGATILKPPIPIIVAPTTAGTGSEVTKNAVIFAKNEKFKASIRSPLMIPKIAIIDPLLMTSISPFITATCGMDALTQLIEAYTSNKAHLLTDTLAIVGIEKIITSLLMAYRNGQLYEPREDMAFAALLSGICLANVGLGAVHGFASPMGGLGIPHGVICSALLAPTIEANIRTISEKDPNSLILQKYDNIGKIITAESSFSMKKSHKALIEYLKNLTQDLKIPSLSKYGVTESDVPSIVEKAQKASSMKYNPVLLDEMSLKSILMQSIQ